MNRHANLNESGLRPQPRWHTWAASSNRRTGHVAEANDACKRVLAIQPNGASMVQRRLADVENALEIKED